MKVAHRILGLAVLVMAQFAYSQNQATGLALGENTRMNAGGQLSFGYAGDYGDAIPSDHGLNFGFNGNVNGSYYSPTFLSFTANPYYNQSRTDSESQSITGASGVTATANFFTGSHFPGSFNYHYDHNSTGSFGLAGEPNFTTIGSSQGFGISWGAMVTGWPTLAVGYSQGSGEGNLYGTSEQTNSSTRQFNANSTYFIRGFHLLGSYMHTGYDTEFPDFLTNGGESQETASANSFAFGAQHNLPLHGSLALSFSRNSSDSEFQVPAGQVGSTSNSFTTNMESANAKFHPMTRLNFNFSQGYTSDLTGYVAQQAGGNGGVVPNGLNLGPGSHSFTVGGGAGYLIARDLTGSVQATYYDQAYLGQNYSGEYVSGTVNYNRRVFNMFTFSASVVDSSTGQGENALGFAGMVNFFKRFDGWVTTGQFAYAQNVQTVLVTYQTSYYLYNANVHKRIRTHINWAAGINGSHSGLTNEPDSSSHSLGFTTSLSTGWASASAFYSQGGGIALLGAGGLIQTQPIPGLTTFLTTTGSNYGGSLSVTPIRRLSIAGAFSRAISETIASTTSYNNTEVLSGQLQYSLRQIGLQAGYLHFTQGISAIGTPANTTSFYVGMTRWFNFF